MAIRDVSEAGSMEGKGGGKEGKGKKEVSSLEAILLRTRSSSFHTRT